MNFGPGGLIKSLIKIRNSKFFIHRLSAWRFNLIVIGNTFYILSYIDIKGEFCYSAHKMKVDDSWWWWQLMMMTNDDDVDIIFLLIMQNSCMLPPLGWLASGAILILSNINNVCFGGWQKGARARFQISPWNVFEVFSKTSLSNHFSKPL